MAESFGVFMIHDMDENRHSTVFRSTAYKGLER